MHIRAFHEVSAYLGCARYERRPYLREPEHTHSGAYERQLWTQYGCIPALRVPKLRRGNRQLEWQTIGRYERCWGPWLDQQLLQYCLGHSLRDLQETMLLTVGEVRSLEACNRLVLGLQEQAQAFKTARLEVPPPLVLVDGLSQVGLTLEVLAIDLGDHVLRLDPGLGCRRAIDHLRHCDSVLLLRTEL